MEEIFEGIYVEENNGIRRYTISAEFSDYIKALTALGLLDHQIDPRSNEAAELLIKYIRDSEFRANLDENGSIHVQTADIARLLHILSIGKFLEIEQATAILANEIKHITSPELQKKLISRKNIEEAREIVISPQKLIKRSEKDGRKV